MPAPPPWPATACPRPTSWPPTSSSPPGPRALRDAGQPGSLQELRARAYLDALLDREPDPEPAREPTTEPLPALVNLTLPLATQLGLADEPGAVAGFGPVDPELARQLATLAASHPRSRCCLTLTGPDGRTIGHGCFRGPGALADLTARGLALTITPPVPDPCGHRGQEPGYEPSRI